MALRVSGKNLDLGDALRQQVEARVAGALAKYFDGDYSGHVTVARDGTGFRTDCVLHLTSGVTLEVTGAAHDAYASFDQTAGRLERRLSRYKRRLKERPSAGPNGSAEGVRSAYTVLAAPDESREETDEAAYHPVVIAEDTRSLPHLAVSEAVLELDDADTPCLVFLHAGTGRVNVVYRRRDGAVGWVDPRP